MVRKRRKKTNNDAIRRFRGFCRGDRRLYDRCQPYYGQKLDLQTTSHPNCCTEGRYNPAELYGLDDTIIPLTDTPITAPPCYRRYSLPSQATPPYEHYTASYPSPYGTQGQEPSYPKPTPPTKPCKPPTP
jgi:hypothetical protein